MVVWHISYLSILHWRHCHCHISSFHGINFLQPSFLISLSFSVFIYILCFIIIFSYIILIHISYAHFSSLFSASSFSSYFYFIRHRPELFFRIIRIEGHFQKVCRHTLDASRTAVTTRQHIRPHATPRVTPRLSRCHGAHAMILHIAIREIRETLWILYFQTFSLEEQTYYTICHYISLLQRISFITFVI